MEALKKRNKRKTTTYLQKAEDAAVELTSNTGFFVCFCQNISSMVSSPETRETAAYRQPERTAGRQHIWKAVVVCCVRNLKVSEESSAAVLLFVDPIGPTCAHLWQITLKKLVVLLLFLLLFFHYFCGSLERVLLPPLPAFLPLCFMW